MTRSMLALVLLAAGPVAGRAATVSSGDKPVMKVVRLLQDMQAELQHELEDDRAVHEALDCWCKTNDREKSKAIELAEALAPQLQATIDESRAKVKELTAKRKATKDEIYAEQKSLGEATELRMNEHKAFHDREVDLIESVKATKQALAALDKHAGFAQLRSAAQHLDAVNAPRMAVSVLRADQLNMLRDFLRQAQESSSATAFLSVPGFQSYRSQSGAIIGILQQMESDFSKSLSDLQAAEKKAADDFAALKAAKEQQIATGNQTVTDLEASIAEFQQRAVQAEKQLADTLEQLELDRTFLANLRKQCADAQAEYDARVKSRTAEIAAVQDAVQILNSEDAFAAFGKGLSLLQTSSTQKQEQQLRRRAAAVLSKAAARVGAPQLALLAASTQLDAFEKVKESIDLLVSELQKQQKDEVAHRDWCIDELATNDRATAAADDKRDGLVAKIADLDKAIDAFSSEIDATQAAMAELQVQMRRASETRESENADFQQTILDQRLTQEILSKALKRLQQVYAFVQQQKPGAAHTQTSATHTDPGNGPARFTKYEQNAGGSKALQLIQEIIADSEKTEAEALRSEVDSQTAYENFIKDSNKSLIAQTKAVSDLSGARAEAEEALVLAKSDLKATMKELENLHSTAGDLHKSCDYILKNFSARQEARTAEMEALREAKNILSGMN